MPRKPAAPKEPKPKKQTAKERKELERLANRCRCHAGCEIPRADLTEYPDTTGVWCRCPDYEFRGGSYLCPVKLALDPPVKDKICRHIHAYRVQTMIADPGTPLGQFQLKNPLGADDEIEATITRLCGPDPRLMRINRPAPASSPAEAISGPDTTPTGNSFIDRARQRAWEHQTERNAQAYSWMQPNPTPEDVAILFQKKKK